MLAYHRKSVTDFCMIIVIKLGTQILISESAIATERLRLIVDETAQLLDAGHKVVIVSSGAVGLGRTELQLKGPLELSQKQACAAVGQSALMQMYRNLFSKHGISAAQILVTGHDFAHRERYLNLKNTFERLLSLGIVPIVNENDVVSVAGIVEVGTSKSFDDNDRLSALVAGKLGADRLLILTNVEGVFDSNPLTNPTAKLIPEISTFAQLGLIDSNGQSEFGRGGMASKLSAAKIASLCGVTTTISSGTISSAVTSALSGRCGTTVLPKEGLSEKRRWIGAASGYNAVITINSDACDALIKENASLLPVGVTSSVGEFELHDIVSIQDVDGGEIGRGIASMCALTLQKVKGLRTGEARPLLLNGEKEEVIHRNNLAIFRE